MLIKLPAEILNQVLDRLSGHEIYHLLTTCRTLYQNILPHLYSHLYIKDYSSTRQLQYGVHRNSFMSDTIHTHTKHLTLCSKQRGNTWRINDLLQIFGHQSHITTLTFSNYHELTHEKIDQVIAILPHLNRVEFNYCYIAHCSSSDNYQRFFLNAKQNHATNHAKNFKSLSLTWTDFHHNAIAPCLHSQITHLELGANRNKIYKSNELITLHIMEHCPNITRLSITLPQVSEHNLCQLVTFYGSQLQHLSIRCDSYNLLHAIALHCRNLSTLTLRISPSADSEEINKHMLTMIRNCNSLTELEVWSCYLEHDIPSKVWESVIVHGLFYTDAIIGKAQQVLDNNSLSAKKVSITAQQQMGNAVFGGGVSSRVWFEADLFEDVLQQRYLHNLLNGNKQCSNVPEKLVICHSVLHQCRSMHEL